MYRFVGKIDTHMPNVVLTASDKRKPAYRGDVWGLESVFGMSAREV